MSDKPGAEAQAGETLATFDEFLDGFQTPTEPVEILMPNGKIYLFKVPSDYTAQRAFDRAKADFIAAVKERRAGLPADLLSAAAGHSDEALGAAFTIHYQAFQPKCNQVTAVRMLKSTYVVEYLEKQLDGHRMKRTSEKLKAVIDQQKKELSQTPSTDSN